MNFEAQLFIALIGGFIANVLSNIINFFMFERKNRAKHQSLIVSSPSNDYTTIKNDDDETKIPPEMAFRKIAVFIIAGIGSFGGAIIIKAIAYTYANSFTTGSYSITRDIFYAIGNWASIMWILIFFGLIGGIGLACWLDSLLDNQITPPWQRFLLAWLWGFGGGSIAAVIVPVVIGIVLVIWFVNLPPPIGFGKGDKLSR